ncbi:hypothetical protein V1525DRAFT_237984 [Lipomyces kononenkoae]|uniref:Uncharacterized protein n=1 Tax=Lipomyces kononenkoae TaxID=34357 RepID=A0ACC3SWN6_LIPKO
MGQAVSTQPSDDSVIDELHASRISASESSVAQVSHSDRTLQSESAYDMDGELPIACDGLRDIANASPSASNRNLLSIGPSGRGDQQDKELPCSSSAQNSSTNSSTRSRRISRHLSSLGLLQAQSRSSYTPSYTSTASASSATAQRAHSSSEPFRRRLPSSSNLAHFYDTRSARNSQSASRQYIPTSTSRILGGGTSSGDAYSSSVSVLRRRRESPTHEEQQERRNAARDFLRSRFSRVRNSLTSHSSTSAMDHPQHETPEPPSAHTSDLSLVPEPTYVRRRPRLTAATTTTALSAEGDTSQAENRPSTPTPATPRRSSRVRSRAFGSTASDTSFSDFLESAGDEIMASAESSGRPRGTEDQAQVLSRLLSVAAAATAASLVGGSTSQLLSRASSESRRRPRTRTSGSVGEDTSDGLFAASDILNHVDDSFGNEEHPTGDSSANASHGVAGERDGNSVVDGTFSEFLRSLQTGRLAQELRQESTAGNRDGSGSDEPVAPLNFFRMFRFPSEAVSSNRNSTAGENGGSGRMIPVIIVGIRSVHGRNHTHASDFAADILPSMAQAQGPADGSNGATTGRRRRSDGSTDFTNRGRSTGQRRGRLFEDDVDLDDNDDNDENEAEDEESHDSDDHYRTEDDDDEDEEDAVSIIEGDELRSSRDRQTRLGTAVGSVDQDDGQEDDHTSAYSRRRGSTADSDSGDLNSTGGGRLNNAERSSGSTGASNVRSWIIYVLGGQYPENHPILTTPSLFTDNPTYEDMLLLSSFIGPAKPPVATQEDIDRSGGIVPASEENLGERCLVCLSDFEEGEECRKLGQCGHLFHKNCIDEWLTTGRNSCPLCRAPGVAEAKSSSNVTPAAAN